MEYFGVFAFLICIWILSGSSHPAKVKKLQRRLEALEKRVGFGIKDDEVADMSRLIKELEGKWCIMDSDDLHVEKVRVCDIEEKWVKVEYEETSHKKGEQQKVKTKLIRVSSIDSVEMVEE